MDTISENPSESSNSLRSGKANMSIQNRRKLADVGNTLHRSSKNPTSVSKSNRKVDSTSCTNSTLLERRICSDVLLPLDELEFKVAANLNPRYFYDDDIEDLHEDCPVDFMNDEDDFLLPKSLRINSDDLETLSYFKPSNTIWEYDSDDVDDFDPFQIIDDIADLDDLHILSQCPNNGKFLNLDLPFSEFTAPGIDLDLDFSF